MRRARRRTRALEEPGAMPLPFQSVVDDVFFRRRRSPLRKVLGGAVVSATLMTLALGRMHALDRAGAPRDLRQVLIMGAAAGVVGGFLGLLLAIRDGVEARRHRGQPVPLPLRLLFGKGWFSLILWSVLLIGFAIAVTVASIVSGVPR